MIASLAQARFSRACLLRRCCRDLRAIQRPAALAPAYFRNTRIREMLEQTLRAEVSGAPTGRRRVCSLKERRGVAPS
jgi:hypothetical protein